MRENHCCVYGQSDIHYPFLFIVSSWFNLVFFPSFLLLLIFFVDAFLCWFMSQIYRHVPKICYHIHLCVRIIIDRWMRVVTPFYLIFLLHIIYYCVWLFCVYVCRCLINIASLMLCTDHDWILIHTQINCRESSWYCKT